MGLMLSLIEFLERLGASDRRVAGIILELEEKLSASKEYYLLGDYAESEQILGSALEGFVDAERLAKEMKDRALAWVYVTEWLAITGTTMICGYVLCAIMVRRRLYRAVRVTRLESA
jgi:hypothetical protein